MTHVTKALILAAGRGERMRPLTDACPKPLLAARGKRLIEWHLEALARAGVREVVVNTAWLEDQFPAALGDGSRWGLRIAYSTEGRDHGGALETAGGMAKALPRLDLGADEAFWVVSGDVHAPGFDFGAAALDAGRLATLWLVPNPPHHPHGDFGISDDGLAVRDEPRFTWSSIGLFSARFVRELMSGLAPGAKAPLRPYLEAAIDRRALGAALWRGPWTDVGTPERLAALNSPAAG
ncbi:MAG TPA: nucleotidyltransferase family protein [Ideonella sp.]|nr:nucleotidyltransferase family protein [Ideonella sp.]